ERATAGAPGAGGDPCAVRAAYLARLRHAVGAFRAALRFRAGALGDHVARGADLLDRKPVPRARGHAGADPRARRRVAPAPRAFSAVPLPPLPALFPGFAIPAYTHSTEFRLHLALAMIAYGMFTIAALHALLMTLME